MNTQAVTALSPGRQRIILATVIFSQLLVWFDNTVLAIALKVLSEPGKGLGATSGQLQWAVSAYTLTFAALLFSGGVFGDRHGHRRMLALGLVLFGASSVWAALSSSADMLIAARVAMGVGAALLMPATLSIISWTFPDIKARSAAIGLWSASSGFAIALGPIIGGALLDHFWWGSIFLVNIPVVVLGLLGVILYVPPFRNPSKRGLDPAGVIGSTIGLVAVTDGFIEAGQSGAWVRWDVLGPIGLGVVVLALFVIVELRVAEPSFDLRLLRHPHFVGGSVAVMLLFFGVTGQLFYSNFYLQSVRGLSPLTAGLVFLPNAIFLMATSVISRRVVARCGIQVTCSAALLVGALTFACYLFFGLHTPLAWYLVLMAVQGAAFGLVMAPLTAAVLAELPRERTGTGSAFNTTLRQVGGVLGVAVLGTVLSIGYRNRIGSALAAIPAGSRGVAKASVEGGQSVASALGRPDFGVLVDRAYVHAMYETSLVAAIVCALGVVTIIVYFRPRRPQSPRPEVTAPDTVVSASDTL